MLTLYLDNSGRLKAGFVIKVCMESLIYKKILTQVLSQYKLKFIALFLYVFIRTVNAKVTGELTKLELTF